MKKYEIIKDRFEFRLSRPAHSNTRTAADIFDEYLVGSDDNGREVLGVYDTADAALEDFRQHYGRMAYTSASDGWACRLLVGEIVFVEINEYDENGEFDQGGDVMDYAAQPWIDTDFGDFANSEGHVFRAYEWDRVESLMDADLKEQVMDGLYQDANQDVFDAYAEAYREKFGEQWGLDKATPIWN